MADSSSYVSLDALGAALGLPRSWLRAEADRGTIPCLRINRRRLFNVTAVRQAIDERAAVSTAVKGNDNART